MDHKFYKHCVVPKCKSTTIKTPKKRFVHVPRKKEMRKKWLRLARRDVNVASDSRMYFCEDHFDLPNDMENYMQYHVMGSVAQVRMKPGVLPTKFDWHPDKRKRPGETTTRPLILKRQKKQLIEESERDLAKIRLEPAPSESGCSSERVRKSPQSPVSSCSLLDQMRYKVCAVPECPNNNKLTPEKLFITVPSHVKAEWLRLARRDPAEFKDSTVLFFCEDHFNLPKDMENYMQYHLMGSVSKIRMKPDCVPTRFDCQPDRPKAVYTAKQLLILKRQRQQLIEECERDLAKRKSEQSKPASESRARERMRSPQTPALQIAENRIEQNIQEETENLEEYQGIPFTCIEIINKQVPVCRICFAADEQLYHLHGYQVLYTAYETLTGLSMDSEEGLPPFACEGCARGLLASARLRAAALRAHCALRDVARAHGAISLDLIEPLRESYCPWNVTDNDLDTELAKEFDMKDEDTISLPDVDIKTENDIDIETENVYADDSELITGDLLASMTEFAEVKLEDDEDDNAEATGDAGDSLQGDVGDVKVENDGVMDDEDAINSEHCSEEQVDSAKGEDCGIEFVESSNSEDCSDMYIGEDVLQPGVRPAKPRRKAKMTKFKVQEIKLQNLTPFHVHRNQAFDKVLVNKIACRKCPYQTKKIEQFLNHLRAHGLDPGE